MTCRAGVTCGMPTKKPKQSRQGDGRAEAANLGDEGRMPQKDREECRGRYAAQGACTVEQGGGSLPCSEEKITSLRMSYLKRKEGD